MKQLIFCLFILATISSCTTQRSFTDYLETRNYQQKITLNPFTNEATVKASIDSLYNYSEVEKICSTAVVTFDVSKGSITIEARCQGAVERVTELLGRLFDAIR